MGNAISSITEDPSLLHAVIDKDFNKFGLLKFGDDAVDVIYEHLSPQDLARCCRLSRALPPEMARLAKRLVYRLKARYFNSPHVRVPTPGEVLCVFDQRENRIGGRA